MPSTLASLFATAVFATAAALALMTGTAGAQGAPAGKRRSLQAIVAPEPPSLMVGRRRRREQAPRRVGNVKDIATTAIGINDALREARKE